MTEKTPVKVAILVVHGMGDHEPGDMLCYVANGFDKLFSKILTRQNSTGFRIIHKHWGKINKEDINEKYQLRGGKQHGIYYMERDYKKYDTSLSIKTENEQEEIQINFTFVDINWAHLFDPPDIMDFLRWFRVSLMHILTRINICYPLKVVGHIFRFIQLVLFYPFLAVIIFFLNELWPVIFYFISLIPYSKKCKLKLLKLANWGPKSCNYIFRLVAGDIQIYATNDTKAREIMNHLKALLRYKMLLSEKARVKVIQETPIEETLDTQLKKETLKCQAYLKKGTRRKGIQENENKQEEEVSTELLDFDNIVIISHSLGTVICHECIAELSSEYEKLEQEPVFEIRKLSALFTYGSPLDKFRYLWGSDKPNRFGYQIKVHKDLKWYNVFSYLDFASAEIDLYSPGPDQFEVGLEVPFEAHIRYWNNFKCMGYTFYCLLDSLNIETNLKDSLKKAYTDFLSKKNLGYELGLFWQLYGRFVRWFFELLPVGGFYYALFHLDLGRLGDWMKSHWKPLAIVVLVLLLLLFLKPLIPLERSESKGNIKQ